MDNGGASGHSKAILTTLAFLCICTCGCSNFRSENSEASRLIEDLWETTGRYDILPVGDVQIVRANWDLSKGQTSPDDLHAYEVLSQQKAISITSNTDLTSSRNFSWDNFFSLSQQGVIRKLKVSLVSPKDNTLRCPEAVRKRIGTEDIICIDIGTGSVQEVVRSQKFQIGTTQYWLIMGNHRWKWSDTERKIRTAQGKESDENRKFMAIAQYDDFVKKWQIAMVDYAPRTGSFAREKEFDKVLRQALITSTPATR